MTPYRFRTARRTKWIKDNLAYPKPVSIVLFLYSATLAVWDMSMARFKLAISLFLLAKNYFNSLYARICKQLCPYIKLFDMIIVSWIQSKRERLGAYLRAILHEGEYIFDGSNLNESLKPEFENLIRSLLLCFLHKIPAATQSQPLLWMGYDGRARPKFRRCM